MKAALIGHGIGASLTPAMHEQEGRALGLDYSYERFDTAMPPWSHKTLLEMIRFAEAEGYAGVNVTHPFKTAVLGWVDEVSLMARAIGASNTVLFRDNRRIAHNTDLPGFQRAFEAGGAGWARRHVLLLGAGGAGPAVGMALLGLGVKRLDVLDPVPGKAEEVARRLLRAYPSIPITPHETVQKVALDTLDGMVNATPVGMENHPGMALDPARLPASAWIADIVYFPRETELLRSARARGMPALAGTRMALYQAVEAFELITGQAPDTTRMAASLDAMLDGENP
ncbi:shikimate dehydrogenase [Tropicimonas sp. TH_r6]|uniref:shikimate dehydrogenase n=1 Tax=Tropicimonas sp. TH_r6 TaxID=3082085 RepID=UPI0029535CD5|nr:shikimate dehydrogenase [Tropicimonas sp. TH_r6]MDV7141558.1 shikimate dehydrogenase [Tropicimonas sp. TH_r6]